MAVVDRHPDAERLAEYVDNVLAPDDRREIQRHLADCAACREVVADTIAALAPDADTEQPPGRVLPFSPRGWVSGVAAALAAAAAIVLAVYLARPQWLGVGSKDARPELQELVAAVANEPTRPVEGRLTGGFAYAPAPSPTRGSGNRPLSPDVRLAAARIEKQARETATPSARAALGVAYLVVGDFDRAIETLEEVTRRSPQAAVESDLAAAYLARATFAGQTGDWASALAAANQAMTLEPTRPEACFNRALALEGLQRTAEALDAWSTCRPLLGAGPWSDEASRRIRELQQRPQP